MGRYKSLCILAAAGLLFGIFGVSTASATLIGTFPTNPGDTVIPLLVLPGSAPGTLLASISVPFVDTLGTDSGTLVSAVYRESGGMLDFYYQVSNNLTSSNCGGAGQPVCDPISRVTDTSFTGFQTALGFRTDGGSLGGPFVNGSVNPLFGDRSTSGNVVGFSFYPPVAAKLQPGESVLVSGATGNFGSAAVAVALAMGAPWVLAPGRNDAMRVAYSMARASFCVMIRAPTSRCSAWYRVRVSERSSCVVSSFTYWQRGSRSVYQRSSRATQPPRPNFRKSRLRDSTFA